MNSCKILYTAFAALTILTACSEKSEIFFPQSDIVIKNPKYTPCYIYTDKGIILRGAPAMHVRGGNPNRPLEIGKGRVIVFPQPNLSPNVKIGSLRPQDLHNNLYNNDPQVRSNTLYVIDRVMASPERDDARPQVQAMLDDYIKNMADKEEAINGGEFDTAKTVYDHHFAQKEADRPNWDKVKDNMFKEVIIPMDDENFAPMITNDEAPVIQEVDVVAKEIFTPEFPEKADEPAHVEKGDIVKQMEKNTAMVEEKIKEDAIVDKDLAELKPENADDLWMWECNQKACATKLGEKRDKIEEIINSAKSTLSDKTQKTSERLWAICSMKCAAQADKKYEPDVVEFLASYVRRRTPWIIPAEGAPEPPIKAVRPDVQAALFVIAARDRMKDLGFEVNLVGTDLRGADMSFANLYNTNLSFSNLSSTNLEKAYGLMDWNKIYLATIDVMTKIPDSVDAGFIVTKKPVLPPQPVGSYTVTTDDWIFWNAVPVK